MSLRIEGLQLELQRTEGRGRFVAIRELDLELEAGELLAVMGASASGKSLLGMALLGLVPPGGQLRSRRFELLGRPLDPSSSRAWRGRRGVDITWVPQAARASLDPYRTVAEQLREVQRLARRPAAEIPAVLERVGLHPDILSAYPHTLSGGLAQRVALALALAPQPRVVVADEPTTALDLVTKVDVLNALRTQVDAGLAVVLVTHDIEVTRRYADRVVVVQAGRVVARGTALEVCDRPAHPRVQALVEAREVAPVDLQAVPAGCAFIDCPRRSGRCEERPELRLAPVGGRVACHHPLEGPA